MSSNYYYLVASLPKITFDLEQKDVNMLALKKEVEKNTPSTDYAYIDMLFMPYDICNLLNKILERKLPFSDKGCFTEEQLEVELEKPSRLPAFMSDFVRIYKGNVEPENEEEQAEHEYILSKPEIYLYTQFYNEATLSKNKFIKSWFTIDRDMRNILAAVSARRLGVDRDNALIGAGETVEALAKSTAVDFGLRTEVGYLDKLLQITDTPDMLERERQLDVLRMEQAENLSLNHYFDIDYILSILQRADIADRWLKLDKTAGTAMFRQMLKDIQAGFDIKQALSQDPVLRGVERQY
jgi:hypothetical protein